MKRPRLPIMSTMRIRRSEWRATRSATSYGWFMREPKAARRSSRVNFATLASSSALMPSQMKPHSTVMTRTLAPTRIAVSPSIVTEPTRDAPKPVKKVHGAQQGERGVHRQRGAEYAARGGDAGVARDG
jgi:hypothetical protein